MGELRGVHQEDALLLCLRQNFAQSLERRGVRMANGHGLALFAGAAQRQFELFADRGHFGDVVEEGDISEGRANSEVLRRFVSYSRGGWGGVGVKEGTGAAYRD